MKTSQLLAALTDHYRKPGADRDGEVLITEASPPGSDRRIDLLRIGLWASRGRGIDGHELKVTRADWLRELDDKAKAEAWWPYVHRWWIVAPSTDIVHPNELPDGWGLMIPPTRGRRFKILVKAAKKEPRVTVPLMVELIRRTDNARLGDIDRIRRQHHEELYRAREEARAEAATRGLDPDTRERLHLLDQLEEALGLQLSSWGAPKWGNVQPDVLAAAMRELAAGVDLEEKRRRLVEHLERNANDSQRQADRFAAGARELQEPHDAGARS